MEYYNEVEKRILELYKKIELGNSEICRNCRLNCDLSLPVGCWCVGNHFFEHEKRVLFVGKNARGNPGKVCGTFRNSYEVTRDYLWERSWPYWSYTGAITEALFGEDSPEHIAFTNIVKCNDSPDVDTTSDFVKEHCIKQLKVLRYEIEIIKPTHIIFYTSWDYDNYIGDVFDEFAIKSNTQKKVGRKNMPWLEANASINQRDLKVLRIGHPERKKKEDFVNCVVDWVNKN